MPKEAQVVIAASKNLTDVRKSNPIATTAIIGQPPRAAEGCSPRNERDRFDVAAV